MIWQAVRPAASGLLAFALAYALALVPTRILNGFEASAPEHSAELLGAALLCVLSVLFVGDYLRSRQTLQHVAICLTAAWASWVLCLEKEIAPVEPEWISLGIGLFGGFLLAKYQPNQLNQSKREQVRLMQLCDIWIGASLVLMAWCELASFNWIAFLIDGLLFPAAALSAILFGRWLAATKCAESSSCRQCCAESMKRSSMRDTVVGLLTCSQFSSALSEDSLLPIVGLAASIAVACVATWVNLTQAYSTLGRGQDWSQDHDLGAARWLGTSPGVLGLSALSPTAAGSQRDITILARLAWLGAFYLRRWWTYRATATETASPVEFDAAASARYVSRLLDAGARYGEPSSTPPLLTSPAEIETKAMENEKAKETAIAEHTPDDAVELRLVSPDKDRFLAMAIALWLLVLGSCATAAVWHFAPANFHQRRWSASFQHVFASLGLASLGVDVSFKLRNAAPSRALVCFSVLSCLALVLLSFFISSIMV